MSYPLERPLPNVAAVRAHSALLQDAAVRQIIVQLCDCIDYLNAQLHTVADAVAVPLEE